MTQPLKMRILRTVANHPGSTPADVLKRAFNHGEYTAKAISALLQQMHAMKLLRRGYAFHYLPRKRKARFTFADYTYWVSRDGFETLKHEHH